VYLLFGIPECPWWSGSIAVRILPRAGGHKKFTVEIRNKNWLDSKFADVLREHNVVLALTDTSFMPRPWEMKEKVQSGYGGLRLCSMARKQKEIEEQTATWDKTVIDRTSDLKIGLISSRRW